MLLYNLLCKLVSLKRLALSEIIGKPDLSKYITLEYGCSNPQNWAVGF